jgi:hypothetical protein
MDSAAASKTTRNASATQKHARKTSMTAPEALVTAPSAATGEARVSEAADVQRAATESFARVRRSRSPAVSNETEPILLNVSSKACLCMRVGWGGRVREAAEVQRAAMENFARVKRRRSPAVRRETEPILLRDSSKACLCVGEVGG